MGENDFLTGHFLTKTSRRRLYVESIAITEFLTFIYGFSSKDLALSYM